jgi:hypothetical protein
LSVGVVSKRGCLFVETVLLLKGQVPASPKIFVAGRSAASQSEFSLPRLNEDIVRCSRASRVNSEHNRSGKSLEREEFPRAAQNLRMSLDWGESVDAWIGISFTAFPLATAASSVSGFVNWHGAELVVLSAILGVVGFAPIAVRPHSSSAPFSSSSLLYLLCDSDSDNLRRRPQLHP